MFRKRRPVGEIGSGVAGSNPVLHGSQRTHELIGLR